MPGILGEDPIRAPEHFPPSYGQITQMADGRSDDTKCSRFDCLAHALPIITC